VPDSIQPSSPTASVALRERALAALLGLHGLALMVVFPLGPQSARLWHPGINGFAVLTSAFPFAAVIGGILARRTPRLPSTPRALAVLAFATTLPCAFSFDYQSLVLARFIAGLATGATFIAIHRVLPVHTAPFASRLAPRIVAFGMPVCLLAATMLDWRAAFMPILIGYALIVLRSLPKSTSATAHAKPLPLVETAPAALVATATLAYVTAAYLTVLSGFLVFNAGHTELHIPVVLSLAALLGLTVPPVVKHLRRKLSPPAVFASAIGFSTASLLALLTLRGHQPAFVAVSVIALFLAAGAARHLALAGLVLPHIPTDQLAIHQTHTHLAHHLGSGLGALTAGLLVTITPVHTLTGMPAILGVSLLASAISLMTGLFSVKSSVASITTDTIIPGFVSDNGSPQA
jgi:predicted MFS family arabinose efflux permease